MARAISTQYQLFPRKEFEVFKTLGRSGRIEVLTFLMKNPEKDFTMRDIARSTNIPTMTVSRCIKDFEKLGMVRKRRIGRAFAISVFKDSPVVEMIERMAEVCEYE